MLNHLGSDRYRIIRRNAATVYHSAAPDWLHGFDTTTPAVRYHTQYVLCTRYCVAELAVAAGARVQAQTRSSSMTAGQQ